MTLEEYIKHEGNEGKIDFSFRAFVTVPEGRVFIYIHTTGKDGLTTPMMEVRGNEVINNVA